MQALSDHVILITGAGGGLGSTAALALAAQGATIILLDKKIPALESVYDQILDLNAPQPAIYPFDLMGANEQQYAELAHTIEQKYGVLHGLLHSAVDSGIAAPIANISTSSWAQSININLNAPFLLTRVLLPVLQKSQQASIVFTSDSSARRGKAYAGVYGVAKIAIEGLASILADELEAGQKIRVNTLVPGPVDSPLRKRTFPAEDKNKLPKMDSLNAMYVYLLGPQSIGKTGQILTPSNFNRLTS